MSLNDKYFALEGPEACGKSIQLKLLKERLESFGHKVLSVREPGDTPFGEEIRTIMLRSSGSGFTSLDPETFLFLMNACRVELIKVVRPWLETGAVVLSDRSYFSTIIYQSYGQGLDREIVNRVCRIATKDVVPSKIFVLDIPVEDTIERLAKDKTKKQNVFDLEKREFHSRIREGYLQESGKSPEWIEVVDATKSVEEISGILFTKVISCLENK